MSGQDRLEGLRRMLERNPSDARVLFGLAAEYEKRGDWENVITSLEAYLNLAEDQGNAWGRLGNALVQTGRVEEAKQVYARGIEEAYAHGHPSMAAEFEGVLADLL